MKIQDKAHDGEVVVDEKVDHGDGPLSQEQVSTQKNIQDLDQEQNVNANPVQLNTQNLYITNKIDPSDYCGKINGVTYIGENKILPNADILLFFGDVSKTAVYKTKSDEDGNFLIEDLPPGYYSIIAYGDNDLREIVQYIKVLAGQNVYQSVHLRYT